MMMKSSMNSPAFSLLLLTAHLCLWITPAYSITITQSPTPAVVGQDVKLEIPGFNPTAVAPAGNFLVCSWFFGPKVDEQKLISVFVINTPTNKQTGITIDDKCAITIKAVSQEWITTYTYLAHYKDKVETKTIALSGAERFGMPSIVLLSLAGLISSMKLF